MISELSGSMQVVARKIYEKIYSNLTESWTNISGTVPDATDDELIKKGIYDIIHPWLQNFRKWLFDNINTLFDDLFLETKGYMQKGVLGDLFKNAKNFFGQVKEKVDTLIRNIISNVQTVAPKIAFKAQS